MFDFLSGIGDFLGGVADAIGAALSYLLSAVLYLFNLVLQLLSAVAQFFAQMLKAVGAFFSHLWHNFFKSILPAIWKHVRDAAQWLHDHLARVFSWLQRLRTRLDAWYRFYIVPYLNMIQRIRQYLHILALFHIKWAQQLDQKLAQMQAQIVQAFATVRASLNALVDIGNALVDPTYLLRKPQLLLSIRRQVAALSHAFTGRPVGYWFPSPRGRAAGPFAPFAGAPLFASGVWSTPPSSALGDDAGVGDLSAFLDSNTYMDNSIDQQAPLDYFNDDLYPESMCPNGAASCLISTWS